MELVMTEQRKKIHPHKFTLWVAIGSITMMFAGLTSAYIIKRNQPNWLEFDLPVIFWYSTAAIVSSSITIWLAVRAFRQGEMAKYRKMLIVTFVLGIVFVSLQVLGFIQLWNQGITLTRNVSVSFLYPIVGLHAIHVIGGVIALLIMFLKAFSRKQKTYSAVPVEMMSTYWHFVDLLWIYLLFFLLMIR
ncbi:MAG: heme-copper oxidase subunit [Chitinophagaceae bacterium]|nr:heme-copper oxidase subunit [Chitinophagaceae bacterium]MDB5222403.1 heme-copper oxidase subunit [Chitinophagaceae bacterium]